ncbi:TIGR02285 family protein [Sulfurospirillum arcachonense]|uniref:TIGR02285 family protein n=1 Tax=Sulfurospirillum arcachonense TaxID=57666 RepID=UPI0004680CB7|nr:TIGR02285 family protein [Sulfurospirillum arcachonense]
MLKYFYLLSILFTFSFSKDISSIYWSSASFPPADITEGPLKERGYCDAIRTTIIKNLPELQHTLEIATVKVSLINLKRLDNACIAGMNMNKDRINFVEYSKPALYSLPNELTIRKQDKQKYEKYLTSNNEIDLEKLLKDNKFIFGYVEKRSYSNNTDKLIKKYQSNLTSMPRKGEDLTKGLLYMLAYKRVDFIIEYPTMVKYIKKKYNMQEEFIQYPIKDSSSLIKIYVGCSKTQNGKKIIEKINKIIDKNKNYFTESYKKWISPNSLKRYNKALVQKVD